jgi:hypothetical protein
MYDKCYKYGHVFIIVMGEMGIVYFVLKIKQFYMIDNCIIEIRSISV